MFERLIIRLDKLAAAPATIAAKAAPRIAEKLRADATTKRGNVPQFGPGPRGKKGDPPAPDVPIAARAIGSTINVLAAGWVLAKAVEKGQPEEWVDIIREVAREEIERG